VPANEIKRTIEVGATTDERSKDTSRQRAGAGDFGEAGRERERDWAEPTESVARRIWLLLELLRNKHVPFTRYERIHHRNFRSFQRDLPQLRSIGGSARFTSSNIRNKERVDLLNFERLRALDGGRRFWGCWERWCYRSGSCYLVGYDLARREWRTFALDRFLSLPQRAGTIQHLRTVPREYDSDDVIGFMKGAGKATSVTVKLTPAVAASATSRRWQTAQHVEALADGFARITFVVSEPTEVVRWALGFGADAHVVGPPEVVALAKSMVEEIARAYAADA
jgi:hypothetical protein